MQSPLELQLAWQVPPMRSASSQGHRQQCMCRGKALTGFTPTEGLAAHYPGEVKIHVPVIKIHLQLTSLPHSLFFFFSHDILPASRPIFRLDSKLGFTNGQGSALNIMPWYEMKQRFLEFL